MTVIQQMQPSAEGAEQMLNSTCGSRVQVEIDDQQLPKRFRWLGRWHRILKCTKQEVEQHLWSKLREQEPVRYRCKTYQGLVCELYFEAGREVGSGRWSLERVWD